MRLFQWQRDGTRSEEIEAESGLRGKKHSGSRRAFFKWGVASAFTLGLMSRLRGAGAGSKAEGAINALPGRGSAVANGAARARITATNGRLGFAEVFEEIKQSATKEEMFSFLYDLPKGGDLHHHHGGATLNGDWFRVATTRDLNGDQRYFTRYRIENCPGDDSIAWWKSGSEHLMYWITISERTWSNLPACDKSEFKALDELTEEERERWKSSVVLDEPEEGRHEFFEYHWSRLNELFDNPYVMSELLIENMKLFGAEGLCYMEPQVNARGFVDRDGRKLTGDEVYRIFKDRVTRPDALATGVSVRFGMTVLRFRDDAPEQVARVFDFIYRHRDLWCGINLAGREDNEKGHPRRFTKTFDEALRRYPGVGISIHAGEENEPSKNVFETLRLGATRIGHGVNLIDDAETMQLMRCGKFLLEINLISNHLLGYVDDLEMHPFPIYMRQGIPCCLNTDDRGMWDSNMTDEYFVAVTNFNLSWDEIVQLGRNSIAFSFADPHMKKNLMDGYEKRIKAFEDKYGAGNWRAPLNTVSPVTYGYGKNTLKLSIGA